MKAVRNTLRSIERTIRYVVAVVLISAVAGGPRASLVSPRAGHRTPPTTLSGAVGSTRIVPGRFPLRFEANRGQADPQVRFLARGQGYTLFLTQAEATLALQAPHLRTEGESAVVRMKLVGANPRAVVQGQQEISGKTHCFIGRDPRRWRTNVPAFAGVKYESIYPGVDLVYHGEQGELEYDLLIAPGSDLGAIRLKFEGANSLSLDAAGDLIIRVRGRTIVQHVPGPMTRRRRS